MKFNLRQALFVTTAICVALVILRRPILFLVSGTVEQSHFLNGFSLPFIHWLWLCNLEWVVDWDMVNNPTMPEPLFFAGCVTGGILSFFSHILLLCFGTYYAQEVWAWCNKEAND